MGKKYFNFWGEEVKELEIRLHTLDGRVERIAIELKKLRGVLEKIKGGKE